MFQYFDKIYRKHITMEYHGHKISNAKVFDVSSIHGSIYEYLKQNIDPKIIEEARSEIFGDTKTVIRTVDPFVQKNIKRLPVLDFIIGKTKYKGGVHINNGYPMFENFIFVGDSELRWIKHCGDRWVDHTFAEKTSLILSWKADLVDNVNICVYPLNVSFFYTSMHNKQPLTVYPFSHPILYEALLMALVPHSVFDYLNQRERRIVDFPSTPRAIKSNKKRGRDLEFSMVTIDLQKPVVTNINTNRGTSGIKKCQYDVPCHIRRLRNPDGSIRKVVKVKAHLRGDPNLGIKLHGYIIE